MDFKTEVTVVILNWEVLENRYNFHKRNLSLSICRINIHDYAKFTAIETTIKSFELYMLILEGFQIG